MSAAAALAFVACGAAAFAAGLLLALNPRHRDVRWVALLLGLCAVWLALQGWGHGQGTFARVAPALNVLANALGGVFLAWSLTGLGRRGLIASALAAGAAMGAVGYANAVHGGGRGTGALLLLWQLASFGGGTVLLMRSERRAAPSRVGPALLAVVPVMFLGSVLVGATFHAYGFPLTVLALAALLFAGILSEQMFDVEVRAARVSEAASAAAEEARLSVVGLLAASLAHEIRNPLAGVRSLAQRLRDSDVPAESRARYGEVIVGELDRIERLVSQLVSAARRPEVSAVPVPLPPLFADLELLAAARGRKRGVTWRADAAALSVLASRDALLQALLNLLLNAIDQAPPGSDVELSAVRAADGRVTIAVADRGPGLPAGGAERLFQPFVSGGEGTGLGLAVVRHLADQAGWSLDAENREGGGARFALSLPAGESPA